MRKKNGNRSTLLVIIGSLFLTACGGGSNSTSYDSYRGVTIDEKILESDNVEEMVVELEEEDTSVTISLEENEEEVPNYVKMGAIYTDCVLGRKIWTQYEYDNDGVLYAIREYDADSPGGCYENKYDTMGNITEYNWVGVDGSCEHYTFWEYDENGNLVKETSVNFYGDDNVTLYENETDTQGNVVSRTTYDNFGECLAKRTYEYHDNGGVKKETRYLPDGTLQEELFYDEHGNMLDDKYYQDGELYIHSTIEYEYDNKGNKTKSVSLSAEFPKELTYKNYYDEQGNLIKIETYEDDGTISQIQEYAYMEFDESKLVCSLDETYAILEEGNIIDAKTEGTVNGTVSEYTGNGTIVYEVNEKVKNSDFEVDRLIQLLELDLTQFTFGQYGKYFMTLQKVIFEETGELNGQSYCSVRLEYDSDYGEFVYWGRVFYETNLNGIQVITGCGINGNLLENPKVDWQKEYAQLYEDSFDTHDFYYQYWEDGTYDKNQYYLFNDGNPVNQIGFIRKVNSMGESLGEYTMLPSSVEGYEYELRICWIDTGLCTKFYVNRQQVLLDPEDNHPSDILQMYYFDQYKGLTGEYTSIICPD